MVVKPVVMIVVMMLVMMPVMALVMTVIMITLTWPEDRDTHYTLIQDFNQLFTCEYNYDEKCLNCHIFTFQIDCNLRPSNFTERFKEYYSRPDLAPLILIPELWSFWSASGIKSSGWFQFSDFRFNCAMAREKKAKIATWRSGCGFSQFVMLFRALREVNS